MTVTVTMHLTPEAESRVYAQAAAKGVPLERYLEAAIERLAAAGQLPFYATATPDEWSRALRAWAEHRSRDTPLLSDEAIRRASIYGERV